MLEDVVRGRRVPQVFAAEAAGAVRQRPKIDRVPGELDLGHLGQHRGSAGRRRLPCRAPDRAGTARSASTAPTNSSSTVIVTESIGSSSCTPADVGCLPQGQRPGHLEGRVGGIDAVCLAADQGDPQVDHRVPVDAPIQLVRGRPSPRWG